MNVKEKPMSEKKNLEKQVPNNVLPIGPTKCTAHDCKAKPVRAGWCNEHFDWFKMGLVTKEGQKAPDFDKKWHAWEASKKKKVA
jgi:hypothetical protein